jgi:hypothetical protein
MQVERLERNAMEQIKDLMQTMATALADYPESIRIEMATGTDTIVIELDVDKKRCGQNDWETG